MQLYGIHGLFSQHLGLDAHIMNIALETYQNEGKHLNSDTLTLKSEGFYRKHTVHSCALWKCRYVCTCYFLWQVFVCCDAEDVSRDFDQSLMNKVIDKYANTITLFVTVPPPPAHPKINPDGTPREPQTTPHDTQLGFQDNFVGNNLEDGVSHRGTGVTAEGCEAEGVAADGNEAGGVAVDAASVAADGGEAGSVADGEVASVNQVDGATGVKIQGEEDGIAKGEGNESTSENGENKIEKLPAVNMEDTNRPLQRSKCVCVCVVEVY